MQRYKSAKTALLSLIQEKGWSKEQVASWLATPIADLNNRTPKQLMNPRSLPRLMRHLKSNLP